MTQDWRKIERAISDFLEREGLSIGQSPSSDTVASEYCPDMTCDVSVGINVTKLARELADLK